MQLQSIPLGKISESPLHLRREVPPQSLQELAESIKSHGVLEPLIVRPVAKGFEIVAGHRRFSAAAVAGQREVPAIVRELSDKEALEIQVIENLQRADVHPLEEAEGFRQLIEKHGYDVEGLAAKVGKSKGYVYARMKLCALVKDARKAFFEGTLDASTALLVARMPASLQPKLLKDLEGESRFGDRMSYREAREHIDRNYMLRLGQAPFDPKDAELVPKAGVCAACPKRTGNAPDLFGDIKGADVCTDPACFASKVQAHGKRVAEQQRAAGRKVIEGPAAKKLFPYGGDQMRHGSALVQLEDTTWEFSTDGGNAKKWRSLVGKALAPDDVVVVVDPHGKVHECVEKKKLPELLKTAGVSRRGARAEAARSADSSAIVEERRRKMRAVTGRAMVAVVMSKASGATPEKLWPIVEAFVWHRARNDVAVDVLRLHGIKRDKIQRPYHTGLESPDDALLRWIKSHPAAEQVAIRRTVTLELMLASAMPSSWGDGAAGKELRAAAQIFKVDLAKVAERTRAEFKKKLAERKASKPRAGSGAKAANVRKRKAS